MSIYEALWKDGLEQEIISFASGLNWLYIIMLVIVFYGKQHTNEIDWFTNLLNKIGVKKYHNWFTGIIAALVFSMFRYLEGTAVDAAYVSSMLRSMFLSVIFSNIFVDIPVVALQKLGKVIDQKEKSQEDE